MCNSRLQEAGIQKCSHKIVALKSSHLDAPLQTNCSATDQCYLKSTCEELPFFVKLHILSLQLY